MTSGSAGKCAYPAEQLVGCSNRCHHSACMWCCCLAGAVDDEGRVWVWGNGSSWQLGHGSRHHDCEPQQVGWQGRAHCFGSGGRSSPLGTAQHPCCVMKGSIRLVSTSPVGRHHMPCSRNPHNAQAVADTLLAVFPYHCDPLLWPLLSSCGACTPCSSCAWASATPCPLASTGTCTAGAQTSTAAWGMASGGRVCQRSGRRQCRCG